MIAGLCENVARIAPIFDSLGNEIVATSKTKVTYESQESREKLHIPKVSVIAKVKPSFLVYSDIYQLGGDDEVSAVKHNMKNCTVVKSTSWLIQLCSPILLSYGKPILDSKLPSADLQIAKRMAKNESTSLISFNNGEVQVFA